MAKKAQPSSSHSSAAVDALLTLAAERGWQSVSLADIAQRAGLTLVELYQQFPSKGAILREFHQRLDVAVLTGDLPGAGEGVRDHVFEVMMRRFDAMQPHKEAIRAILRDSRRDPLFFLCSAPHLFKTASLMLEASGNRRRRTGGPIEGKGAGGDLPGDPSCLVARRYSGYGQDHGRARSIASACRGRCHDPVAYPSADTVER